MTQNPSVHGTNGPGHLTCLTDGYQFALLGMCCYKGENDSLSLSPPPPSLPCWRKGSRLAQGAQTEIKIPASPPSTDYSRAIQDALYNQALRSCPQRLLQSYPRCPVQSSLTLLSTETVPELSNQALRYCTQSSLTQYVLWTYFLFVGPWYV